MRLVEQFSGLAQVSGGLIDVGLQEKWLLAIDMQLTYAAFDTDKKNAPQH